MQSGYGGVSEIPPQFMVEGCPPSLFSISSAPPNASPSASAAMAEIHEAHQKFHPLMHHGSQLNPQAGAGAGAAAPPPPPHFAHFGHPGPITQQLFQQPQHHQFQLFHHHHHHQRHHHLGMDQDSGPEASSAAAGGGTGPSFLAAMNFKLGVNDNSAGGGGGGGSRDGMNDDGMLQGDDGSESRLHHHPWHRDDQDSAAAVNIKEPFWRPLDIDYINPNNKRPAAAAQAKDKHPAEMTSSPTAKHFKKSHEGHGGGAAGDSNYKLFSELEAIYKPGGTPTSGGGGGGGGGAGNNQTGSGSALTGDGNSLIPAAATPGPAIDHNLDNISDTSNADDVAPPPAPLAAGKFPKKQRSKRRQQHKQQLASIATFFESLVKQLMDHQEALHRKFLEVMERRDQERAAREEAWRKQEAAKASREAAARAQERALAASREAAIISFLEKISGESLNLPTKLQFQSQFTEESLKDHDDSLHAMEPYNADTANNDNVNNASGGAVQLGSSRWPKAEVQALIRVRSGLETRFQEPGLKGPLWEEVSTAMAAIGYSRSSKRCKEKWENINKYFRKTKESGKKRPQHSKTCPYFQQLDQLYSKPATSAIAAPSSSNANAGGEQRNDVNSELLDAIVVSNEAAGKRNNNENDDDNHNGEDTGDRVDQDEEEEEGQGESQGQGHDDENENSLQEDSAQFLHRLRS